MFFIYTKTKMKGKDFTSKTKTEESYVDDYERPLVLVSRLTGGRGSETRKQLRALLEQAYNSEQSEELKELKELKELEELEEFELPTKDSIQDKNKEQNKKQNKD
jgi:hypothetical protein